MDREKFSLEDHEQRAENYGSAEKEFSPENNEAHERLKQVAANIVDCFDWQPDHEDFIVVTDTKVMDENPLMLVALQRELDARLNESSDANRGAVGRVRMLTTKASPKSATRNWCRYAR